jgi:outer membrane protein OmpA-like peptidoglycan-associated protein
MKKVEQVSKLLSAVLLGTVLGVGLATAPAPGAAAPLLAAQQPETPPPPDIPDTPPPPDKQPERRPVNPADQPAAPQAPASPATAASAAGACPAPPSAFGTKEKTAVSMEGKIYFLPENAEKLPDFSTLPSQGSIYAAKWDVPARNFTEGFPGVTNRFEWFALDYQGSIYVPKTGTYAFRLGSDDGAILYLDGKKVIDNDGVHGWSVSDTDKVDLSQGEHRFRLSYFQGPATELGLQLWVTPPGEAEKIFALQDFNKLLIDNRRLLAVTEDEKEIHVKFGSEILFDTAQYVLKPAATKALEQLAGVIRSYPGYPVKIEGHTDSVGKPDANQTLSENRAGAVKDWLVTQGNIPPACITTQGFGQRKPIAGNETPGGRQQNRRVEVHLVKPAPPSQPENQ